MPSTLHCLGVGSPLRITKLEITLRIAILAPPWIPIPPPAYGGIEQVVALQAAGLAERGHEVTLFAAKGSRVDGVEVVESQFALPDEIGLPEAEALHLSAIVGRCDGFDVVIDHSSPAGLALSSLAAPPVLHVVHGPIRSSLAAHYRAVCALGRGVGLVAISGSQRRTAPFVPFAGVCHNALHLDAVPFQSKSDGYLAFLGRMSPEKGVAQAIQIARAAGRTLKIAAKCREAAEIEYFEREVAPHIGPDVIWLGELGEQAKYELLGGAAAMVFPIDWDEPFGLVMIESMACGTPVLATARGAVPEVVVDRATGFVRRHPSELAALVDQLDMIDRRECRAHVESQFSGPVMAARYEALAMNAVRARATRPRMTSMRGGLVTARVATTVGP